MKQSKFYRRLLGVVMAAIMVLSLTNGMSVSRARAAETGENGRLTWEKVENNGKGRLAGNKVVEDAEAFEENYVKDGMVRASIILDGEATLKKYSADGIATNASAKSYRNALRAEQDALAETISKKALGGEKLDVVWHITLAANIISANIPYAKLDAIRMVKGVKDVVLETRYEPDVVSTEENDPNMATASDMVGGAYAWAAGLTGAGSKIAIVDTGLDKEHQSYDGAALEKALEGKDVDLLTAAEVEAVFDSLNASQLLSSADGIYNNTKVPYGVNYVDGDLDIVHVNDTQGNHGSHVAGIAAANRYIPDGNGGFVEAMKSVMTQGEAPDAQLLIMKVFGKGGGAYDSDYMIAIEDAIVLGADAVNLSLGSGNPGLAYNSTYADILDEVSQATNLVWANSAGNSYSWPDYSSAGYLYADDVSFATGGSPATYNPTLSVSSVVNKGSTAYSFEAAGSTIYYTETSGYGNDPMRTLAGDQEYVIIAGPGVDDNDHVGQDGDQFLALGEDIVKGKIAMCYRGTSSFFAKVNAAAGQGAIGVVIINNQDGVINMNLTGITSSVPAVSITQADGEGIIAASEKKTDANGNEYYTGTMTINELVGVINPGEPEYYTMSEFSSWGVPGNLSLKPEITAPGGSIYSISGYHQKPASEGGGFGGGHTEYEVMSGTSMASPQIAGLSAVFAQYIRENDLTTKTNRTQRQLTLSLLMSTAEPIWDENGDLFPVILQGSGLANVAAAMSARSYVTIDSVAEKAPLTAANALAEGKVKVELGEVKADSFTTTFTLHNFSDEKIEYYLDAEFFTQWLYGDTYRTPYIDPLSLAFTWKVDGQDYEPADADLYDFNGDGVANGQDAQYLLEYCAELHEELFCEEFADLDEDGDIDTYDARLAFELLNGAAVQVDKKDVTVTLTVSGLDNAFAGAINGNYIEGYIYATEGETNDGALGVTHSIPVLGFYGNWTDGSMYDKGSVIDYYYGLEDRTPYLYNVTGGTTSLYVGGYIVDDNFFIGNPYADDAYLDDPETALYLPERNAISKYSVVNAIQYTQIRNAGAGRFFVTDAEGNLASGTEQRFGSSYAAYYYVNGATWRGSVTNQKLNFTPKDLTEDGQYVLNYQLAPEYYLNADGSVRWDEVGEGASFTLPFVVDNTAPTLVNGAFDEETKSISVEAKDNQWIAAVALYTDDGEIIDYYGGIADLAKGEAYTYEFDLSEVLTGEEDDPAHFLVEIYDYAQNLTTYKLNLNPDEADDPIQVKIDQTAEEAQIINNGTLQLTATVTPWGYASEEVVWTSSDETKATVDEDGLVTSVASTDCTVTITATSVQDETASDSIEVTIAFLHQDLNGIVWDEEGQVWMSKFDIGGLPNYTKLHNAPLRTRVASAAYDEEGTLYACTLDTDEFSSIMYTVNEEDWTFTEIGSSTIGFMDVCQAPSLGENHLLAVYGPYVLLVDKTTGQYETAFDFGTNYTNGANLVGIAYEEVYNYAAYGDTDWVFLVDENGTVWNAGFLPYNGSYANFKPSKIGTIGAAVDQPYFQSLYFDGASLFWSRFVEADNKVDLIMVKDLYTDGSVYNLGSFADGVWPVGGLYEQGKNPYFGEINKASDHSEAVIDENMVMTTTVEPVDFGKKVQKSTGSLNAAKDGGNKTEPDKISTEVKVELTAEELTKNALVTIEYPETVELVRWSSNAQFKAWNDQNAGKIIFAFVDLEGFEEDEVFLTLAFSKESAGQVTITTSDVNEDDENETVETVDLGFAVHEHVYTGPVWEWAEDYSAATATFTCALKDDTQTLEAVVTFEDDEEAGIRTYTAKVEFQGKEYTDTKEAEIPFAGFEWTRIGGANRYTTMQLIVNEAFPEAKSCKTIIVAVGNKWETGLMAAGLAGALDAPFITVPVKASQTANITPALEEIERLAAEDCTVLVLGAGKEADDTVVAAIQEKVANVRRIGEDCTAAAELASLLYAEGEGKWNQSGTVILASGTGFADSLSISPYAYASKTPIFYTNAEKALREEDQAFMTSGAVNRVIIVGGVGSVSEETEEALKAAGLSVVRLAGDNRYLTSAAIVKWELGLDAEAAFQPDVLLTVDNMGVAKGNGASAYADALTCVDVLGTKGGVLLLVADDSKKNKETTMANIAEIIEANKKQMKKGYIFGGTGSVSEAIEEALNAAVAAD